MARNEFQPDTFARVVINYDSGLPLPWLPPRKKTPNPLLFLSPCHDLIEFDRCSSIACLKDNNIEDNMYFYIFIGMQTRAYLYIFAYMYFDNFNPLILNIIKILVFFYIMPWHRNMFKRCVGTVPKYFCLISR